MGKKKFRCSFFSRNLAAVSSSCGEKECKVSALSCDSACECRVQRARHCPPRCIVPFLYGKVLKLLKTSCGNLRFWAPAAEQSPGPVSRKATRRALHCGLSPCLSPRAPVLIAACFSCLSCVSGGKRSRFSCVSCCFFASLARHVVSGGKFCRRHFAFSVVSLRNLYSGPTGTA